MYFWMTNSSKKIEAVGLADQVQEIDGKKAVQVGMTKKDQKKLIKGFESLTFDANNACVLPEEGNSTLMNIICRNANLGCYEICNYKIIQSSCR